MLKQTNMAVCFSHIPKADIKCMSIWLPRWGVQMVQAEGKQCWPWSNCSLEFPWTESTLFALAFISRARENWKNSRSGPKLRILDRFQTPQNANKSVQQVCALNPIFPKPTNFHESMMSKKSQTVKSSQTDNVRAPFKCDIMVVKRL